MKLEPTQVTYEWKHENGYGFKVVSTKAFASDGYFMGWTTRVELITTGNTSPEAGVEHLRLSAQEYLRQTKGLKP